MTTREVGSVSGAGGQATECSVMRSRFNPRLQRTGLRLPLSRRPSDGLVRVAPPARRKILDRPKNETGGAARLPTMNIYHPGGLAARPCA